jgi:hypothetical protein
MNDCFDVYCDPKGTWLVFIASDGRETHVNAELIAFDLRDPTLKDWCRERRAEKRMPPPFRGRRPERFFRN